MINELQYIYRENRLKGRINCPEIVFRDGGVTGLSENHAGSFP